MYAIIGYWDTPFKQNRAEESVQFIVKQREYLLELNALLYEINEPDKTNNNSEIEKKILELSILLI